MNEKVKTYEVINDFKDSQDNDRIYQKEDTFPHGKAKKPTEKRIKELLSNKNKIGKPVIKERV